jgi:hypothetical protein
MPKTADQWILFRIRRRSADAAVEAIQVEGAGRERTAEVSGKGTQEDRIGIDQGPGKQVIGHGRELACRCLAGLGYLATKLEILISSVFERGF